MKIKKVIAANEKAAVEKIEKIYGPDALILNVQKVRVGGFFGFLKKPQVMATAIYNIKQEVESAQLLGMGLTDNEKKGEEEGTEQEVEEKLKPVTAEQNDKIRLLEGMLTSMEKRLMASKYTVKGIRVFDNSILQVFYEALLSQGVLEEVAGSILNQVEKEITPEEILDISFVSAAVYAKILNVLGNPVPLKRPDSTLFIFFCGPTGVGKTTTIAKLASRLVLEQNVKVGLITADTYRIAAVEQLKVYAEILNLDIDVIYEKEDFIKSTTQMQNVKDIVFIDTAGRSHKNSGNLTDLKELISVPLNSEKFLVLSMTTKYEDLLNIIETYKDIGAFKIILTKFDETLYYGNIFNLCFNMNLEVAYITNGQNVPDDVEILKPEKIAKALLGLDVDI